MFYEILKPITKIFYHLYYKLEHRDLKNVPQGKPIILAPNHTNGFVDPISIGVISKSKIRFFARGDVFKGRVVKWLLNDLNMSPMYRLQEGYGEIKKNNKTFEECKDLLSKNKTLLIFPEAICIPERRLQPLKKGLSRIIFQTEEAFDFKKNVFVVPVGLNYTNAKKFRSELFIHFGEPISLKQYEEFYKTDKVKAINAFTKILEEEMRKLIITIKNTDNDELADSIHEIYLHQWMKEKNQDYNSVEKKYHARKEIVDMINRADEQSPETIKSLKEKIIPYLKHLQQHQLRDHLLYPETIEKSNIFNFFTEFIIIWLGMPLYGLGLLMNYLPFYIAKSFADKKIKQVEFYASIYLNMAMLIWIIYFAIQLLIIALTFRNWLVLSLYALLVPLTGFYVLKYYSIMKKIFGRWRLLRMVRKDHNAVKTLVNERTIIVEQLNTLKKNYLLLTHQ